jgi:dolichyl-diphosphooligosaccharide--protein glycosyltransferase
MQWLKENTPEDAVIASWWDYGYWITTLAERKTLVDNATLIDWQIRKVASMFMSTSNNAWQILTSDTETDVSSYYVTLPDDVAYPTRQSGDVYDVDVQKFDDFKSFKDDIVPQSQNSGNVYDKDGNLLYDPDLADKYSTLFDYWISEVYVPPPVITGLDADYVLINLAVQKLSEENMLDLYTLEQKGGDETKAFWFLKIADLRILDYYGPELTSYTDKFWNETFIGELIPFTPVIYVDPNNPERQSETFKQGYTAIYVKNIKFPSNAQDSPFQLVYVPPSFEGDNTGPLTGPLIYKINKEYLPHN